MKLNGVWVLLFQVGTVMSLDEFVARFDGISVQFICIPRKPHDGLLFYHVNGETARHGICFVMMILPWRPHDSFATNGGPPRQPKALEAAEFLLRQHRQYFPNADRMFVLDNAFGGKKLIELSKELRFDICCSVKKMAAGLSDLYHQLLLDVVPWQGRAVIGADGVVAAAAVAINDKKEVR
jgi:hypothetical protein